MLKRRYFPILLVFLLSSLSLLIPTQVSWTEDGNLLKRSPEETCHGCHKTDRNAPADLNSIKTHNSTTTGSAKWAANGGWGIPGGKYGEFGCTTCHTAHATRNIFLIKDTISTPDGSNWESTGTATINSVVLKKKTQAGSPNPGVSDGVLGDDTGGHASSSRVCQVCHTMTNHHRFDTSGQIGLDHYDGQDCTQCHLHENGFVHGGGGGCQSCHGHEDDWPVVPGNTWRGSKQSHGTHTENDIDDRRGPNMACADCHDTAHFPRFKDGQDLAGTTVCDNCHSPGGVFNGVNSASGSIGAKNNWKTGVYTGNTLQAGKEKWCVGCHDAGTAVIGGRQAPDVAGNNTTYGYYVSGHGSASTECAGCHGLGMNHNFDGKKTYLAASNNYVAGFRLKANMTIPNSYGCNYNSNYFALCYSCHNEQNLMSDTKGWGCYSCTGSNPFKNAAAIVTQFRNRHPQGHDTGFTDIPANFHADHLIDAQSFGAHWYSDGAGTGTGASGVSCTTCHNPHGDKLSNNNATIKMTRGFFEISHGSDAIGQYGQVNNNSYSSTTCNTTCHWDGTNRWYYNAVPYISSMAVSDMNTSDPSPADVGFTNSRDVRVTLLATGGIQMMTAEDSSFTVNPTAWVSYASPYTYTLSATAGAKQVYVKLKNAAGESNTLNYGTVLDMTPPNVSTAALTSPNGGEAWIQGSSHAITWSGVSDTNLKVSPITLKYSTDGGVTYPNTIAANVANSGTYTWTLPMINSANVRVQLIATDRAGNQATDVSDANFTISP